MAINDVIAHLDPDQGEGLEGYITAEDVKASLYDLYNLIITTISEGPIGPQGIQGPLGPQGIAGPVGPTGPAPTFDVGTVETGTADVSLSGNESTGYHLNLILPSAGADGVNTAAIQNGAVTSEKIANGTIVNADVNTSASIDRSKIAGTAVTQADSETVTSEMLTSEAAGDLFTGVGSGAVGILPAGANGLVLTTDDGETAGVKWSAFGIADLDVGTVTSGSAAVTMTGNPEDGYSLNFVLPPVGANGVDTAAIQNQAVTSGKLAATLTLGSAPAGSTLGSDLGDGVALTQALTGLTIGATYLVTPVSGTLTSISLDGTSILGLGSNSGAAFVATATSHTVVGVAGTATAIAVKLVTARAGTSLTTASGVPVSLSGTQNLHVGHFPSWLNTAYAMYNTGVGYEAQRGIVAGGSNNAFGVNAQRTLTNGNYNNAHGGAAQYGGAAGITGSFNDAFGHRAQYALTTGSSNSAFGYFSQTALTTGTYNTSIGTNTLQALTTGSFNVAVGSNAGIGITTGSYNIAIGSQMAATLTGSCNIGIGVLSLNSVTSGGENIAVGREAQKVLTTGTFNVGVGYLALNAMTTGLGNTAYGASSLRGLTTGANNTAIGNSAGRSLTTGSYNLALGSQTGYSGTTATLSGVVVIGTDSGGVGAQATADNQFVLGTALHTVTVPGTLTLTTGSLSTIDAKGDLLVGTKDSTVGRLPAGDDGTLLGYDAAALAGARPFTAAQVAVNDPVFLSTITWPQAAGHRLGGGNYGEETIASADMCLAGGVKVLECDYEVTSDGEHFLMHDSTLDRTTDGTGTISGLTGAAVSQFRVNTGLGWTEGAGYAPQRIVTVDELTARYRGRAILVIEPKSTNDPTVQGPLWRKAGLADTIIVQRWVLSECQAWAEQGFDTMFLTGSTVDPATVVAAGIPWIGYSFSGTGTEAEIARVQAAKAAGLMVGTWTHTREAHAYAARAAGSDMPMSDLPVHCNTTPGMSSVNFVKNILPPSTIVAAGTQLVEGGLLHHTEYGGGEYASLIGALGPIPDGTFSVTMTFRCTAETVSSPYVHWASIFLGGPRDTCYYKGSDGYHAILRMDGSLQLYRFEVSGGVTTQLAYAATPALVGLTDYTITLQISPTGVTLTRLDTGDVITAADTTHRPATWWPSYGHKQSEATKMIGCKSMAVSRQ